MLKITKKVSFEIDGEDAKTLIDALTVARLLLNEKRCTKIEGWYFSVDGRSKEEMQRIDDFIETITNSVK